MSIKPRKQGMQDIPVKTLNDMREAEAIAWANSAEGKRQAREDAKAKAEWEAREEHAAILRANPHIGVLVRKGRKVYYSVHNIDHVVTDPRELLPVTGPGAFPGACCATCGAGFDFGCRCD